MILTKGRTFALLSSHAPLSASYKSCSVFIDVWDSKTENEGLAPKWGRPDRIRSKLQDASNKKQEYESSQHMLAVRVLHPNSWRH